MRVFQLREKRGLTLIEAVISVALFGLLVSATIPIFRSQAVSAHRSGELAELQDNLRIAAYYLSKDIREAVEVVSLGNGDNNDGKGFGPGEDNAFKIKVKDRDGNLQTISYYYRNTDKTKNVFYRKVDDNLQPLTNEYPFSGATRGYLRKWEIEFYKGVGITTTDDKNEVRMVKFTLCGGYGDKDDFKVLTTSVLMRTLATP